MQIDLNCDMGESFGRWELGADAAVMPYLSSVSIACGAHAGDPGVMRRTLRVASQHGVSCGAHPGFADLAGFGRREIQLTGPEATDLVLWQLGALEALARSEGIRLRHVKAHGALYNMAARDNALAEALAAAVATFDRTLVFFGLAGSGMLDAGRRAGLTVAAEGFADRSYEPDGSLTPRSVPGSVIHDVDQVVARAVRMACDARVTARNGAQVPLQIDTICIHGDTPGAPVLARALREGLQAAGVRVAPVGSAPSVDQAREHERRQPGQGGSAATPGPGAPAGN
jgi:UPF0271 protein